MNATNCQEKRLESSIERLDWMITDAKRDLARSAQSMSQRAAEACASTEAMLANMPYSLTWVEFAESDLRNAREAKARFNALIEQQKLLQHVLGK